MNMRAQCGTAAGRFLPGHVNLFRDLFWLWRATRLWPGVTLLLVVASISVAEVYSPELVDKPTVNRQFTATQFSPLLDAMLTLESANDAKCHSTACRFEDFLHGTPLSEEARQERFLRQKQLARLIWAEIPRKPEQTEEYATSTTNLSPIIEQIMHVESGDGAPDVAIVFPLTGREVIIPATRRRQYSSIAYSLRAALSLQQDELMGENSLPPLQGAEIDQIQQVLDDASVCALQLADKFARKKNEARIGKESMQEAWQALFGTALSKTPSSQSTNQAHTDRAARRLLNDIAKHKQEAYNRYNILKDIDPDNLLLFNIARFYARFSVPEEPYLILALVRALGVAQQDFTLSLLKRASGIAKEAGHSMVRDVDANRALQELLPQEIDDWEDVHLFSRLGNGRRITLESYDCDSFRDFGTHWGVFDTALKKLPEDERIPDPQAAEIVAEAISQHGVLVLRLAGDHVRSELLRPVLGPEDLQYASKRVRELAREHAAQAPRETDVEEIISADATNTPSPIGGRTFFVDATRDSRIRFEHRSSQWLGEFRQKSRNVPPTFPGGGLAAGDVDRDGHLDLLFVGGGGIALYAGEGAGRFREATAEAGLSTRLTDGSYAEIRQPIIADLDNDGWPEILLTLVNDQHRLYRNLGQGKFEDMSSEAALGGRGLIGGPATVFDFDNDGLLDIYICYNGQFLDGNLPHYGRNSTNASPNALFHNEGKLRFRDVTAGSGAANTGWAQAVSHVDFDRDGRQDIVIGNDFGRNAMLRNLGGGKFEDHAVRFGMTAFYHSMNVGITDLNGDLFPDFYISNIGTMVKDNKYVMPHADTPMNFDSRAMAAMLVQEANMLYLSRTDQNKFIGLQPSKHVERSVNSTGWAWDAEFFDFDNDQDEDLYVLNGNNDYNMFPKNHWERFTWDTATRQERRERVLAVSYQQTANCFFENSGGVLKERSADSGAGFYGNSRSAVYLDMDEDGDLDIVVNNFQSAAVVLRNNTESLGRHWLKIKLIGDPKRRTNRDAIGAMIIATLPSGHLMMREVHGGSGFLSMEPLEQHFGLGAESSASVTVLWPNGDLQKLGSLPADLRHVVHQSDLSARLSEAENE